MLFLSVRWMIAVPKHPNSFPGMKVGNRDILRDPGVYLTYYRAYPSFLGL